MGKAGGAALTYKVRHHLEDTAVVIKATRDGHSVASLRMPDKEALRLGWALVSDLDPDEVDEIQREQGEKRKTIIRGRMMRLMAITPCTLTQMGAILGVSGSDLGGFILPMAKAGQVYRTNPRVGRNPAIFGLTDAGYHQVAKENLAQIPRRSSDPKPPPIGELFQITLSPKTKRKRRRAR